MAATRIIPLHVNKGKTIAQSLNKRTDYAKNPEKTEKGELVTSYECDPMTVDEEFMLSKRQYEHSTGRHQKHDVIAYQIRQSFKPGEVTAEEANKIGYELAMSFTKGNHAFIVATYTDRAHIHNHIVFNSTTLDGSRKFVNFFLSYLAVQKISDRLCVQHGLSIIDAKPYNQREKKSEYPQKHTFRDDICESIDAALLMKPADFEAFLRLLEADGYEIKRGKNIALKGHGQQRYIRLRSLGKGYSEEELRAAVAGEAMHQPKSRRKEKSFSTAPPKLQLLIDIEAKRAEGKGGGYVRWANSFNLKQMAEAVCFIKEHGIDTYEELAEKTDAAAVHFNELSASIKSSEERLAEIAALKKHIINYGRTKETYAAYRKSGYSRKFLEEHREDITLHKAAKEAFNQLDKAAAENRDPKGKGKNRIPTIKQLNQEYAEVLSGKKKAYADYRSARKEMQDYLIARKNIEAILGMDQKQEEQEKEKLQEQQKNQNR
ncbi:MAG: relaxase/mobilization nuclease domain-containing protein [Lachnospiraceae bacterium]|nr:relaxase/mobilization nuclease domain-containing protein [Lachnospiraceae bacterium]